MTIQRAALLIVALLAVAWFAVSYRDARLIRNAQLVAAAPNPTPGQIESALRDVRRPHTLDPNETEALSYQAVLELRAHRVDRAIRLLEEVARREPDQAEPYLLLAELNRKSDPARAAEARARLHHLDPLQPLPPR
jgi:predicted Zn-dependent protease